tara:strand:+ start:203 stop:1030 length:828 start_codon:yes stop_codon:yes gene_type:complete
MKKEEAKKVEFGGVSKMKVEFKAPTKPTEDVSKQTTQIDEIMMSEASTGNQKIVLVNMITETIKSKKVVLEYDEENKTTGIIKKIKFDSLNQIENKHIKGFVDVYKKYLGVDTLKSWDSTTENGKERMRILKEAFWVAIVTAHETVIVKNKKGESFTGNKNSEILVDGDFARKHGNLTKKVDQHPMKFSQLKKATQNYIKSGDTKINSSEKSVRDNSFQSLMKKSALAIDNAKQEIVLGKNNPNDLNSVKNVFIKAQQYIEEHKRVQDSLRKKAS